MIISLVVAAAENNAIGKNNGLLWHLPNDMTFFKNITWGMPVIMGRKTFDSMKRPLKGRTNIVITRNPDQNHVPEAVLLAKDPEEALRLADNTYAKECFVIGGGEIYRQFLPMAARIFLTRVHTTLDGEVFFPEFGKEEWELTEELPFTADEKHAYAYTFQTWKRKKPD